MDPDPPDPDETDGTNKDQSPPSPRKRLETKTASCTQETCDFSERDDKNFQCNQCKRLIHYRCTGLPLYQIHQFLTKKYRNYVCVSCTQVPQHLKTIIPRPPAASKSKEVADLEEIIKANETQIHSLAETNRLLQAEVRTLTNDFNNEKAKSAKGVEERTKLVAEAKIMKKGIAEYENKITEYQQNAGAEQGDGSLQHLAQIVSTKFEEVEKSLKLSILAEVEKCNQKFEEKLSEVVTINKSYAESLTNTNGSVSATGSPVIPITPTSPADLRAIMREEENEKLADETDKKRRACNFIVHGVPESDNPGKEEVKKHDSDFVVNLIRDVGLTIEHKSIFRLGGSGDLVKRLIKVISN